jgi:uncharacterized protein
MTATYVPTRYLSFSTSENGGLVLYNSLNGAIGAVSSDQAKDVKNALKRTARHHKLEDKLLADLAEGGFLIPEGTDEAQIMQNKYLEKYNQDTLNLIILPTEKCNFHCTYCYESFERDRMPEGIREGIKKFVAGQKNLKFLELQWFGGEPLVEADIVIEQAKYFREYCEERGIQCSMGMTTNGSLLTPEIAEQLIPLGLSHFQITLDGVKEEHDARRLPIDGKPSYDRILENLRYLKSTSHPFTVMLRHNFDPKNLERLEEYLESIRIEFAGDARFKPHFEPIATWGSANDDSLDVIGN